MLITFKNVKTHEGFITDVVAGSPVVETIDAQSQLLSLPTFIDVGSNFNAPLETSDEAFATQAKTILQAGITSIFSKPIDPHAAEILNNQTVETLKHLNVPLQINFFADGTHLANFNDVGKFKSFYKGIKTSIDLKNSSLPPFKNALDRLFQIAAQEDLIVIIDLLQNTNTLSMQREMALENIITAIELTEKYSGQLYIQHIRTQEEIALIESAKDQQLLVFADVSYPHLFNHDSSPFQNLFLPTTFLPTPEDQCILWKALNRGYIDVVSSGCQQILNQESSITVRQWLPTMLYAYHQERLSLPTLVALTRVNPENIFSIPPNTNVVLSDESLASKYVVVNGELITVPQR